MSELITSLVLIILCILAFMLFRSCRKPPGFPPGPPKIPILGSLPFVPHLPGLLTTAADWFISRYGKMVGLYLGDYPTVVLYDYDLTKEVFSRDEVAGRPDNFMYRFRMLGNKLGILFNDGESWKTQRRFLLKTLKDFGFGKKSLEGVLLDEADRLGDLFKSKGEEPILVSNLFNVAILNVLWTIVANHRYELSDEKAQYVVKLITDSITVENLRFLFAVPFSRFIAPEWTGWNKQKTVIAETHALMQDIVEQHIATYDEDNMRDFIDVYLREMKKDDEDFHQQQLLVNAMDLFSAGSETTATTLSWAVCFMILYPQVQAKVQEELDAVIGDRKPSLDDRGKIPYTEATIMEIQRLGSIAPQGVPHRTLSDVVVRGYKIPANTMVISMLYYIMRDPQHWDRPEEFRPERFIDGQGKIIKEERFVPFGVGKRVCIGESLAKTELFLILTRLLQLYSFQSVPGKPQPTVKPVYGFILSPQPFYAKAVPR